MGKKDKPRVIPEQDGRIIGTICMCQLTLVLSGVALVYLSVAVYSPSYKLFISEFEPVPVMCETVNMTMVKNCTWHSCSEWCLTRSSGYCPQIYAMPRRYGSNLTLYGCKRSTSVSCPLANFDLLSKVNCNLDTECNKMKGLYSCTKGHCFNISELMHCTNKGEGVHIDVNKDSGKLTGNYECFKSRCTKIKRQLECEHVCPKIQTAEYNVYLSRDNTVVSAQCTEARASDPSAPGPGPAPLWNPSDGSLLTSCFTYEKKNDTITATDCVNGTVIPPSEFPKPSMNYTQLRHLWAKAMEENAYNRPRSNTIPRGDILLPPSHLLYLRKNWSALHINLQKCVNTLRGECLQFIKDYGGDGRNFTARSRYLCYYKKSQAENFTVLARYNVEQTWNELMVAIFVPSTLFVISLTTLCIITRSVKVGDDAKLRCLSCCSSRPSRDAQETPADT